MNAILEWLLGVDSGELAGTDWSLRLLADYNQYVVVGLLLALAALIWLTVRSYRREGDAPPRAKGVLAGIRILVIALAFLLIFQPAMVLRFQDTIYQPVAVLIDDSLSMDTRDAYAEEDEPEIAVARAKLTEYFGVSGEELAELSRSELVRRALLRKDGLLTRLAADHPLVLARFPGPEAGRSTAELGGGSPLELMHASAAERAEQVPARLEPLLADLRASGAITNVPAALRGVIDQRRGKSDTWAGVIVFSDGRNTADAGGAPAGAEAVRAYADDNGVRVYSVLVGDWLEPKNLSVLGLQVPQQVRSGNPLTFTVTLRHRRLGGERVTVRLQRRRVDADEWTDTDATTTVVLAEPDPAAGEDAAVHQDAQIPHTPGEVGSYVYRAVVEPLGGERDRTDNAAEALVHVSERKVRILLVSGDAGKEFQFLRNMLYRQPELYRLSVWQQNADPEVSSLGSSRGMVISHLPRSLEELVHTGAAGAGTVAVRAPAGGEPDEAETAEEAPAEGEAAGQREGGIPRGYDVVILYDPQYTSGGFDERFAELLETFVFRHGGGLCFVASNKYSEGILIGGRRGAFRPLANLLPVTLGPMDDLYLQRLRQGRRQSFPVTLTPAGRSHRLTRLVPAAEASARIWTSQLPGVYWSHPVQEAKSGARVLATHAERKTHRNRLEPVLAVQSYGKGRTVYVGTDETWRWRLLKHGQYHRRFWYNLVDYLAMLAGKRVRISAAGDRFDVGERIRLRVEAYDAEFQGRKEETLTVELVDITGQTEPRAVTVRRVEGREGHYQATIEAKRPGTYELRLKDSDAAPEETTTQRITIERSQAELDRIAADREAMLALAGSEQRFAPLWELDGLAERIPSGHFTRERPQTERLWDTKLSLLLIVALLAAEWIVRKRYNMA